jgi:hypothetical protein
MSKRSGSAILIAILLVATIGTIAFSFGRILVMEIANASIYENGVGSYYAAESGIEEGLLRYRYNKNSEVPFRDWTLGDKKVFRTNLTSSSISRETNDLGIPYNTAIGDNAIQAYDLRMGFLGDGKSTTSAPFGEDVDGIAGVTPIGDLAHSNYALSTSSPYYIAKDETLKFDFPKELDLSNNNALNLSLKFEGMTATSIANEDTSGIAMIRVLIKRPSASVTEEYKKMLAFGFDIYPSKIMSAYGGNNKDYFTAVTSNGTVVTLADILSNMSDGSGLGVRYEPGSEVSVYIHPLKHAARILLLGSQCSNGTWPCSEKKTEILPGAYSIITSTGYYGGTLRTLQAKVDRQSGTLYDLFDYVVYNASANK